MVADDTLTPAAFLAKWKATNNYEQLIDGAHVAAASAHVLVTPVLPDVKRSLADVPEISNRLLNSMRNAEILTVEELALNMAQLNRCRNIGSGTWKEAISIAVRYGGQFNPEELPIEERAFAVHLLGRPQPDPNGVKLPLP